MEGFIIFSYSNHRITFKLSNDRRATLWISHRKAPQLYKNSLWNWYVQITVKCLLALPVWSNLSNYHWCYLDIEVTLSLPCLKERKKENYQKTIKYYVSIIPKLLFTQLSLLSKPQHTTLDVLIFSDCLVASFWQMGH